GGAPSVSPTGRTSRTVQSPAQRLLTECRRVARSDSFPDLLSYEGSACCYINPAMRNILLAVCLAVLACGATVRPASSAEVRPRIRAVTAFIEIDSNNYNARIQEAQKFLANAKDALNKAGFEGAGGRITTQPFPQYTRGMSTADAVAFVGKLREAASKERSG